MHVLIEYTTVFTINSVSKWTVHVAQKSKIHPECEVVTACTSISFIVSVLTAVGYSLYGINSSTCYIDETVDIYPMQGKYFSLFFQTPAHTRTLDQDIN